MRRKHHRAEHQFYVDRAHARGLGWIESSCQGRWERHREILAFIAKAEAAADAMGLDQLEFDRSSAGNRVRIKSRAELTALRDQRQATPPLPKWLQRQRVEQEHAPLEAPSVVDEPQPQPQPKMREAKDLTARNAQIQALAESGMTQKELAKRFGVSQSTVSRIVVKSGGTVIPFTKKKTG